MIIRSLYGRLYSTSRSLLIVLLFSTLASTGCASKYDTQTTKVNYYPDCYAPIEELRKSEFTVEKSTAAGAVMGSMLGAIAGLIASGGKASGAAIGAASGAAIGGAAGYGLSKSQQNSDDGALLADYNTRLDGGIRETDKTTAAARVARQCYERQFTAAASEFKAKRISKEQFNSRYQEVLAGMEEAAAILGVANKNSAQVVAAYNQALNEEAAKRGVSPSVIRSSAKSKNASATRNKTESERELAGMAEKTNRMEQAVSAGRQEERLLQERLSTTRQQAADLMS
jgi:outer membrane lipoprotein SlyB